MSADRHETESKADAHVFDADGFAGLLDQYPDDPDLIDDLSDAVRTLQIREAAQQRHAKAKATRQMALYSGNVMDGLEFLTSRPDRPSLWGDGTHLLWAAGQALLICGPQGVGKSTVAQQLVLARMGLRRPTLFGYTVAEDDRPVLYLAMDRPDQIETSLRRMVDVRDEETASRLKRQLVVVRGAPPFKADLAPELFTEWVADVGRNPGVVILDSVKDMLSSVTADESGLAFNTTVQLMLANGTETIGNHHLRKATVDNRKPDKLDDVYGSRWLTAGQGSVVLLWGEAGARSVQLRHLKPIRESVGPLIVNYDHATGAANGGEPLTLLLDLASNAGADGITVDDAVRAIRQTTRDDDTWRAHSQSVKRLLDKLVERALLAKIDGQRGGPGGGATGPRWVVPHE